MFSDKAQVHQLGRPKKETPTLPPPEVGARAGVRYGLYKLPCTVVHVTDDGKLVKVETDAQKAIYVFKRQDGRGYVRKIPGMVPWDLLFEKAEVVSPAR